MAQALGQDGLGATSLTRTPTYCEVCFWKCAGWVYKNEQGDIWKIIGNDEDYNCNGRFCPRGTGGVGMYYDEDRLKTPHMLEDKTQPLTDRKEEVLLAADPHRQETYLSQSSQRAQREFFEFVSRLHLYAQRLAPQGLWRRAKAASLRPA